MSGAQRERKPTAARRLANLSPAVKILSGFMLLILLPGLFLIRQLSMQSTDFVIQSNLGFISQVLRLAESNLSTKLDSVRQVSDSIYLSPAFQELLSHVDHEDTILQQIDDANHLTKYIDSIQMGRDVYRVRLYLGQTKLYLGERVNYFPLREVTGKPWFDTVVQQSGMTWIAERIEKSYFTDEVRLLSCARMIRAPQDYLRMAGILIVDIDERNLARQLAEIDFQMGEQIYLVDGTGRVVSCVDAALVGTHMPGAEAFAAAYAGEAGTVLLDAQEAQEDAGTPGYLVMEPVRGSDMALVARIGQADIAGRRNAANTAYTVLIIAYSVLALASVATMALSLASRWLSGRLQSVTRALVSGKEGHSAVRGHGAPLIRLADVEKNIHEMVDTVERLSEETHRANLREREAQFNALQAQINPHFLYNTLEMINWKAIRAGSGEISGMLTALARYFRLSLNKGMVIVPVRDEIALARVYLEIQANRYEEMFDVRIDVPEEAMAFEIPKMTLQPIIENALAHGIIKNDAERGLIEILGTVTGDALCLSVRDNGVGMDAQAAAGLLERAPRLEGGYGLRNVHERIGYYFGELYGIAIDTAPGNGFRVDIRICRNLDKTAEKN